MKRIGILGSGSVAKILGAGFINEGYEVMLGTRDTAKLDEWKANNTGGQTGSFADTAAFGELLILAVKGFAAKDVLQLAGIDNLKGKTIIDTSNPISGAPSADGILPYFTTLNESLMEQLQATAPEANFVKSFNSVGSPAMIHPNYKEGQPTMFICGNSETAKSEVKVLLRQIGWDVSDMGKAAAARAIEPLCMLWCISGFKDNEWTHAFKVLHA